MADFWERSMVQAVPNQEGRLPLTPEQYLRQNKLPWTPANLKQAERAVYDTDVPRGIDTGLQQGIQNLVDNPRQAVHDTVDTIADFATGKPITTDIARRKEKVEETSSQQPRADLPEPGQAAKSGTLPTEKDAQLSIVEQILGIKGDWKPPATADLSKIPVPDIAKYRGEDKNLKQFAKDLGVDLKDPYDVWAYIRDISAGLLASPNKETYLGALGDAALLSNKNRATAEAAQKELKAKLAVAKWENDQKWKLAEYKSGVDIAKALIKEGGGEINYSTGSATTTWTDPDTFIKYEVVPVTKGAETLAPHTKLVNVDNRPHIFKATHQGIKAEETFHKRHTEVGSKIEERVNSPEEWDVMLKNELRKLDPYKGNPIWAIEDQERYKEVRQELAEAIYGTNRFSLTQSNNLVDQFIKATGEGKGREAEGYLNSLAIAPGILSQFKKAMETGWWAELNDGEQGRVNELIQRGALLLSAGDIAKDRSGYKSPDEYLKKSARLVLPKINWELEGENKFRLAFTGAEFEDAINQAGGFLGIDTTDKWYKTSFADIADAPTSGMAAYKDADPDKDIIDKAIEWFGFGEALEGYYGPGEYKIWNAKQYSRLPPYQRGIFEGDLVDRRRRIAEATGISLDEAGADYMQQVLKSKIIRGGSDDLGGAASDTASKYYPNDLNEWSVEPIDMREEARTNGWVWAGKPEKRKNTDKIKQGYWYQPHAPAEKKWYKYPDRLELIPLPTANE